MEDCAGEISSTLTLYEAIPLDGIDIGLLYFYNWYNLFGMLFMQISS